MPNSKAACGPFEAISGAAVRSNWKHAVGLCKNIPCWGGPSACAIVFRTCSPTFIKDEESSRAVTPCSQSLEHPLGPDSDSRSTLHARLDNHRSHGVRIRRRKGFEIRDVLNAQRLKMHRRKPLKKRTEPAEKGVSSCFLLFPVA